MLLVNRSISSQICAIITIYLTIVKWCDGGGLPCNYYDSINITAGVLHSNGSITFNGFEFTHGHYLKFNYILNGAERTTVTEYIRGCPCINRPCVRLCCPLGSVMDSGDNLECQADQAANNLTIEITDDLNQTRTVDLNKNFGLLERKCDNYYYADDYKINKAGYVLLEKGPVHHSNYCLAYIKEDNEISSEVKICSKEPDEIELKYRILAIGMLLSIPFIIATFLVYVTIPELRNLRGVCFLCYLVCLITLFIPLSLVHLNGYSYVPPALCKSCASLIYFSFLSAALWLNVTCFDLWLSFRSSKLRNFSSKTQFIFFALYAWGLPLLLTIFGHILDSMDSLPAHLQPGIGTETCFLKETSMSKFLFFNLPLCIIFTVNIVLFVLTALRVHQLEKEHDQNSTQTEQQEALKNRQRKLTKKKTHFIMYLRLFVLMGVTWLMEAISFISPNSNFFAITDVLNTLLGVIIFVLFVLNRRVLHLVKKRWGGWISNTPSEEELAESDSSLESLGANDMSFKLQSQQATS